MKTRGVLFDLYGTLIQYGEMDKAWEAWYGVIYDLFRTNGLQLNRTEFQPYCAGFFERPEPAHSGDGLTVVERRLNRLAHDVGVMISREQAIGAIEKSIDAWHDFVRLDPDAPGVLEEIGQKRSLALVSNFDYAPYVHNLMTRWELEPFFDSILVSDAVGYKKPCPEIFQLALKEIDLGPMQTIHVGDSQEDIEGAVGAGIRPVWIDRQQKDRWRARPDSEVTRITSLKEILHILD